MKSMMKIFGLALAAAPLAGCYVEPAPVYHPVAYAPPPRVVVVAPPPPPPRVVYVPAPPPRPFWIPGHYGAYGNWIPGHWS